MDITNLGHTKVQSRYSIRTGVVNDLSFEENNSSATKTSLISLLEMMLKKHRVPMVVLRLPAKDIPLEKIKELEFVKSVVVNNTIDKDNGTVLAAVLWRDSDKREPSASDRKGPSGGKREREERNEDYPTDEKVRL
jgi:hypothetical protein